MRLLSLLALLLVVVLSPPRPRHAARIRPTVPAPQARSLPIPDYPAFAAVAMRHCPRWETTYETGQRAPYQARHRVHGLIVAASELGQLDELLSDYEPPAMVRPYLDHQLSTMGTA